jgi:hypothetical protein
MITPLIMLFLMVAPYAIERTRAAAMHSSTDLARAAANGRLFAKLDAPVGVPRSTNSHLESRSGECNKNSARD